jgi:hypothetical protein
VRTRSGGAQAMSAPSVERRSFNSGVQNALDIESVGNINSVMHWVRLTQPVQTNGGGVLGGALIIITMAIALKRGQRVEAEHTAAELLSRSWCPSCAENLAEVLPDPDGCTTCPRCQAGWSTKSIG